jgi:hypothetical protein
LLHERGVSLADLFSSDLISTRWGQVLWLKILLVLTLVGFQLAVGHKPSKLSYAYVIVAFLIVGLSVALVRPVVM